MTSLPTVLECRHHAAGECRSCTWLGRPYDDQLAAKDQATRARVGAPGPVWLPPHPSPAAGFRTKAKMVVAGTVERPTVGILDPRGSGVDLRDCGLHTTGIVAALPTLAEFVTRAALPPYQVAGDLPVAQRGELKHLLVTESPDGELMVRWVLRSTAAEARIRKHLPWLVDRLPALRVATVNVQPTHRAVLEGEREIVLTEQRTLPMRLRQPDDAEVTLHLGPRSFFQTNTAVATALYGQARAWVRELGSATVLDLYCGVGGFALHLAGPDRRVTGVEISADAVAAADRARDDGGWSREQVRFVVGDATAHLVDPPPQLVVVNPPRRGLGADLAARLEASGVPHLLYSSCNPETLARDLGVLASYRPVRAQVFDMFPQTAHQEVLMLLTRDDSAQ